MELGFLRRPVEGQAGPDGRNQLGYASAVGGGDGQHLIEAQPVEAGIRRAALHAIDLVDDDQDRLALAAQARRDLLVPGGEAVVAVHQQDGHMGLTEGGLGHASDALGDDVVALEIEAAGVHQFEELLGHALLAQTGDAAVAAVPGHARQIVDQSRAAAGEPVEEGGLAHIGASAEGDEGQFHGCSKPSSLSGMG